MSIASKEVAHPRRVREAFSSATALFKSVFSPRHIVHRQAENPFDGPALEARLEDIKNRRVERVRAARQAAEQNSDVSTVRDMRERALFQALHLPTGRLSGADRWNISGESTSQPLDLGRPGVDLNGLQSEPSRASGELDAASNILAAESAMLSGLSAAARDDRGAAGALLEAAGGSYSVVGRAVRLVEASQSESPSTGEIAAVEDLSRQARRILRQGDQYEEQTLEDLDQSSEATIGW